MWEVVAASLISYLGKKTIDEFWSKRRSGKAAVVNQNGNVGYAALDAGRISIEKEFTASQFQEYETLFGNFYIPHTIQDLLVGDAIALVLVVEERHQQVFLFEVDMYKGYQIDLPHGDYSFFAFVVDADAYDLLGAMIYAIGFPPTEDLDLSGIDTLTLEDHEDIWNVIDDSPVRITWGGPFYLDFILIDTERVPEFPQFFLELLEDDIIQGTVKRIGTDRYQRYCRVCNSKIGGITVTKGQLPEEIRLCENCGAQNLFP